MMDDNIRKEIAALEAETGKKIGIGLIECGECPVNATTPMACMFCLYGHMLDCHYPLTCEQAECSHYQESQLEEEEQDSSTRKLKDMLCCAGDDHTVRQGGRYINLVMLRKLAKWPYLASVNVLVPESQKYPLANAVVCDRCLEEKREIKYAAVGRDSSDGEVEYNRVPVGELEEPEFYWPDHVPKEG